MNNLRVANKIKVLLIVLIIIPFSLTILNFTANYHVNTKLHEDNAKNINFPKVTSPSINIITPENKTYSAPMSGFYPATYGFESDPIGGDAFEWDDSASDANCGAQIVAEKAGHRNVLLIDDNSGTGKARLNNYFTDQSFGTVEFWIVAEDASNGGVVRLMYTELTENRVFLRLSDDIWYYNDGSIDQIIPNVPNPQDNIWQHVTIHFESTSGGYQGLTQYTYEVIIDGVSSGALPFHTNGGSVNRFNIFTGDSPVNARWIDAVAYSWDPNYNVGNNIKEGLLISFEFGFSYDWFGYSLDNQMNNTIFGNKTILLPSEGIHSIQIFGNDTFGTMYKSDIRYFSIDMLPTILINSPHQNSVFGTDAPDFNITIIESNLNESWYSLDNGITNISFTSLTGTIDQSEWDKQPDGQITIRFYANDSIGQENFKDLTIIKDTTAPIILINSPIENEKYTYIAPSFNISITDVSLSETWYTLDNGLTNITFLGLTGIINQTEWDNQPDGSVTLRFYAKDRIDLMNFEEITILKDTILPIVSIITPEDDEIFTETPPSFNISINDTNLDKTWYTLDNGITNITFSGLTGTINQTEWDRQADGLVIIKFYANDTFGLENFDELIVIKDTTAPIITIISPLADRFYSTTPPSFSILITDPYLNSSWYTLDGGVTNITFSDLTSIISQTEWDKQAEGLVTIRFYANDLLGYINYDEVIIYKDTIDPLIIIHFPSAGDIFTVTPPSFNVTITDLNLESMWYTIDGGLNNYYIDKSTGFIDSTAWNAALVGAVTIRFYARDLAGNEEYIDVVLQKNPAPSPPNMNLIIIAISLISVTALVVLGIIAYRRGYVRIKKPKTLSDEGRKTEPKELRREKHRKKSKIEPRIISCPFCQNKILSDQKYCKFCGANLRT
ncbi:MAG: hypothetical protein ACFFBI_09955 [Promethearchaeota archaeon]